MTTPDPATEFMHALDQHPEIEEELRRRLLSKEVIDLPGIVAQLANTVSEMANTFDRRLTAVENRLDSIDGRLDNLDGHMAQLIGQVNNVDGRVANLTGTDYERKAARRIQSLLSRYMRLTRIQVLHSPAHETADYLVSTLNGAMDTGRVSAEEADDLEQADIIVMTDDPEGSKRYIVAEASVTINDSDVDRADRRAHTLATATGTPTTAAVIGSAISDTNRRRAGESNVIILTLQP